MSDDSEISKLANRPPKYLSPDAKSLWLRAAPYLFRNGILLPKDLLRFELFCAAYSGLQNARLSVEKSTRTDEREPPAKAITELEPLVADMLSAMGFNSAAEFEKALSESAR